MERPKRVISAESLQSICYSVVCSVCSVEIGHMTPSYVIIPASARPLMPSPVKTTAVSDDTAV